MNSKEKIYNDRFDKAGVVLSWVCFVHCLALPFAVASLPLSAAYFLDSEIAEYAVIGVTVLIGLTALVPSYLRYHRKLNSIFLFILGLGVILLADRLFEDSLAGKTLMLAAGASVVTVAHIINRRLCASCASCEIHHSHSS